MSALTGAAKVRALQAEILGEFEARFEDSRDIQIDSIAELEADPPCFHQWEEIFPELAVLYDNIDVIAEEAAVVGQAPWIPWPEEDIQTGNVAWTVFPFLHTFPTLDEAKSTWLGSTGSMCPKTAALLKKVPNIRTALFSKLGPGTTLNVHTGWEDLANYVLRCHVCLDIPRPACSTAECR